MARSDRRSSARAKPVAAAAPDRFQSAYVGTEGLFFQRLRRQAKWIFVLLALIFGLSFVVFGVGSEVPGGVADIIQGRAPGVGPSVEDARERTQENPQDAQAWRDLSSALQQEGKTQEAIPALERYTTLEPRDEGALTTLASLYLIRATDLAQQLQIAQQQAALDNPGSSFAPPPDSPFSQALGQKPVTDAVAGESSARVNQLYQETVQAYEQAKLRYADVARLQPEDASVQLQLAQAAENANDLPSAIAAYEQFLKLAPDDPSAPAVRDRVKLLEGAVASSGG
jgi:tetratricopeptide (TPR) repeat protein